MRISLRDASQRECGDCSLCCKLMAVDELKKPARVWCAHARKSCGCAIYETRPPSCRDFQCLWLASSFGAPELRPDKIHGLLTATPASEAVRGIVLHEDPGYPGVAYSALKPALHAFIADGTQYVMVVTGRRAMFYGNPALLQAATAMVNEAFPTKDEVVTNGS